MTDEPAVDAASPREQAPEPRVVLERFGSDGWREMVALRDRILRAPLGLCFSQQQLDAEAVEIHLGLRVGVLLAGTLLLLPPDAAGEGKLRQMAVDPAFERRGFGTLLVRHGEAELRRLGAAGVRLSARVSAIGFYAGLGYVVEGDEFIEVTIRHRLMRKRLGAPLRALVHGLSWRPTDT